MAQQAGDITGFLIAWGQGDRAALGTDQFFGDSRPELVLYDSATGGVEFWQLDDQFRRLDLPVPLTGAAPLPLSWKLSVTGDFNHDGYADLVWRDGDSQAVVIWTMGVGGAPATTKIGEIVPTRRRRRTPTGRSWPRSTSTATTTATCSGTTPRRATS